MANTRSTRRSSAKAITYVVVKDFAGGITAQADRVQIPLGSTPMARNVEWRNKGGFYVRKGVGALTHGGAGQEMGPLGVVPVAFYHFVRDPTAATAFISQYLVAVEDGTIRVGVDRGPDLGIAAGNWLTMQAGGANVVTVGRPIFQAWGSNVYVSVGDIETNGAGIAMHRWDGTVGTALGTAYVDDYAAPLGGNMVPARYMAAWQERMFLACTFDKTSGALEPSRIRWSHPGRPEDYATNDYIDVGQEGEVITGIAAMRDMLVIFKRSSTYALLGSGASNFRVVEISAIVGCTGEFTRDNQGAVCFWDGTLGLCRFDGKNVVNLFEPLLGFIQAGPAASITRCGAVVCDGERIYAATDFADYYGSRVVDPIARGTVGGPRASGPIIPGQTVWSDLTTAGVTWSGISGTRWLKASTEFYNLVWVFRPGCGWTSFSLNHPDAIAITMMGEIRSRLNSFGDVESNRRIVYGLQSDTVPLYLSDRYDNGRDWWTKDNQQGIDAFYMTPWLHGGLPAQIKRWKAPRVIQEADEAGVLLADVFYDFNYDFLRRTLRVAVVAPLSFDSYLVGKPGTIGRAKAVMLVIRPEHPRHWGVASITIPVHPKVMR